ncbi:hypothetical protein ADUPG1_001858, partial [Aduncisulcus paluster]
KEYDGKGIGTGKRRTTLTAQRKKQICLSVIRKSPIFGRIYEGTCDADLIEFYKTRIAPIVTTAKGNYRNKKHAPTLQKSLTKYDDDLESSEMEILREYATCKDWAASVASQSLSQSSGVEESEVVQSTTRVEHSRAPSQPHRMSIFKVLNEDEETQDE